MSKPKVDAAKQPNLSVFFSPKTDVPVQLQNGWDGSQSSRRQSGQGIADYNDRNDPSEDSEVKVFKKRVLPVFNGGDSTGGYNNKSKYPPSSAYGIPKGAATIGGVSFVPPSGSLMLFMTPQFPNCWTIYVELSLIISLFFFHIAPKRSKPQVEASDSDTEEDKISLSNSQMRVLEAILARKSVFFTGAAGLSVLIDCDLFSRNAWTACHFYN